MLIYILLAIAILILFFVIYYFLKDSNKEKEELLQKVENLQDWQIENIVKKSYIDQDNFLKWLKEIDIQQDKFLDFKEQIDKVIVWLDELKNAIAVSLLASGHILVEGVPGLAKTKTISTISKILDLQFSRIQFTPDMMPSDILWVQIYNQKKQDFEIKLWPIYSNIVLADEINRTTPKVQSALLEAMQERKINISGQEFELPRPFYVLATQNPIEQEWTYPLPEAQLDRFLFKILVNYPSPEEEKKVLDILENESNIDLKKVMNAENILSFQQQIRNIKVSDKIKQYIVDLVYATRRPHPYIVYWLSPRAGISMLYSSKAVAFLKWRDYVDYEDVQQVALLSSRHRIILSYEAKLDWISPDNVLLDLFKKVKL